jgi:hypothetical protein
VPSTGGLELALLAASNARTVTPKHTIRRNVLLSRNRWGHHFRDLLHTVALR